MSASFSFVFVFIFAHSFAWYGAKFQKILKKKKVPLPAILGERTKIIIQFSSKIKTN